MFTKKVNYYFIYALVFLFVLVANPEQHYQIILACGYSALFCIVAYIIGWLTLDGTKSAWILGWIAFGLGQLPVAAVLAAFFVSSSLLSKQPDASVVSVRRNARQVWANGFWLVLFVMIWFASDNPIWLYAGIASMATATADTWATEIGGHRFQGTTYLIYGLKKTNPGTDGGISVAGTLASLAGSALIAATCLFVLPESSLLDFFFIAIAGFLGSLADSLLGATKQGKHLELPPVMGNIMECNIDNDFVNWAATGTGALSFLILSMFTL